MTPVSWSRQGCLNGCAPRLATYTLYGVAGDGELYRLETVMLVLAYAH